MFVVFALAVFVAVPASSFSVGPSSATARFSCLNAAKDEQKDTRRRTWDVGRFARTAVFFDAFPNPLKKMAQIIGGARTTSSPALAPNAVVWKPGNNPYEIVWGPLDDVVMGGASQSDFSAETGMWRGEVITTGGGFAGARTKLLEPPLDLSQCRGLRLRLKGGEGRRFKFIVRDDTDW